MTQENDKSHPLRKILHDLPRLKTSDGFEMRLRRRIEQSSTRPQSLWDMPPRPFFIPSITYSSIAVGLVFVMLYYFFTLSNLNPVLPVSSRPDQSVRVSGGNSTEEGRGVNSIVLPENPKHPGQVKSEIKKVSPGQTTASEGKSVAPARKSSDNERLAGSSLPQESAASPGNPSPPSGTGRVSEGLSIDQKNTTTGILELKRMDTSTHSGSKNRPFTPRVKDAYGVGVLGQGVSSSLSDSMKLDSLKKLKKQFVPKALEKRPKE